MKHHRLGPALSVPLVALALTACSSGASTKGGGGPAGPATQGSGATSSLPTSAIATTLTVSSSAPATPAASSPTAGGPIDVCTVVPLATVVSVTGRGYTESNLVSRNVGGSVETDCLYKHGAPNDADAIQLEIKVFRGVDPRGVFALQDETVGDLEPVSGIGDSAQGSDNELDVAWGRDVVVVEDDVYPGTTAALTKTMYTTLAQKVHQAL